MACILGYLLLLLNDLLYSNFVTVLRACIEVEGIPTLSLFSESPSCWHLRVTLTPERPSYYGAGCVNDACVSNYALV